MKRALAFAVLFGGLIASLHAAEVDIPITVSNGVNSPQLLRFGLDPAATDGIDLPLGEAGLPPLPPTGVFDARLVGDDIGVNLANGSFRDYRLGTVSTAGTRIHELKYQPGPGTSITIGWNLPNGAVGRLQDIIFGNLIDVPMTGTGSYTVTNPNGFSRLKMTINYDGSLPIQLLSFTGVFISPNLVRLDWRTMSEVNNYGFEIQKSADSTSYQTVPNSFVQGHGTTNEPHDYSWIDSTVASGVWYYRLRQIDLDGTIDYSDGIRVNVLASVEPKALPTVFMLSQNYPNPWNPSTVIHYVVPHNSFVTLTVYNSLGQQVAQLVSEQHQAGFHDVVFRGDELASGVYLYRLQAGDFVATKKLLLLK